MFSKNDLAKLFVFILALSCLTIYLYPLLKPEMVNTPANSPASILVTDFSGQQVSLVKPAERIVCLLESGLNGLYMLGAQDKVMAVNNYPYQPHIYPYYQALDSRFAVKSIPDVGEGELVDLEKIVALKPDLVIVWSGYSSVIKNLKDRGIKVCTIQLNSFEDIFRELQILGQLTGTESRAAELVAVGQSELAFIKNTVASLPDGKKPSTYFSWADSKLDAAGGSSTGTQLVALAGGQSVTSEIKQEHMKVNIEQILKWNPEVIISWTGSNVTPDKFLQDSQWQNVTAIKNHRVYQLPDAFSCDLWTLKYLYGIKCVASYLHPELFTIDLAREKVRLFKLFYGEKGEKAANVSL